MSTAPDAPTGVAASDSTFTDKVRVTWNPVSGATSYTVHRGLQSDASDRVSIGASTTTSFDDTSAVEEVTYFYWVTATAGGPDSPFSASDPGVRKMKPAGPSRISASDLTSTLSIPVTRPAPPGAPD